MTLKLTLKRAINDKSCELLSLLSWNLNDRHDRLADTPGVEPSQVIHAGWCGGANINLFIPLDQRTAPNNFHCNVLLNGSQMNMFSIKYTERIINSPTQVIQMLFVLVVQGLNHGSED